MKEGTSMWDQLKDLYNSLTNWLGKASQAFVTWLLNAIEQYWDVILSSIVLAAFGQPEYLFVVFMVIAEEIVGEMWNPQNLNQPSKRISVAKLSAAPQNAPRPLYQDQTVHRLQLR